MSFCDTFAALACEGELIVLVARFHMKGKQLDMVRVSEDDGATFQLLPTRRPSAQAPHDPKSSPRAATSLACWRFTRRARYPPGR